jgi:pyruvate dehydrogenase E1 component
MLDVTAPALATNGKAAAEPDPQETVEWIEALDGVISSEGPQRAREIIEALTVRARTRGADIPITLTTPYVNTIPVHDQPTYPGNPDIEEKLRHYSRWNAMAMVVRANKHYDGLGGHVATYSSSATLMDVGFNHFWHPPSANHGGDLVYFQGHASPGVYARAFVDGRLSEEQLDAFRREVDGNGLSSYPHPWLLPDFWQFPTVSMGLGPLQAVYQARFMKYLHDRGIEDTSGRKVWVFVGDGEVDEPETLAGLGIAAREKLDNLIFVVNCNLQRLDGPVRGNGKIIQELEAHFRGSGWNVIKCIWGRRWDPLLANDHTGALVRLMGETLDGDYQTFRSRDGAYIRENFFGKYPETRALVADMSDDEIWALNRGGHDPYKVYTAYKAAVEHTGGPTVVLAKTIKGYGLGTAGEGQNVAHNTKKLAEDQLRSFRDRFAIPLSDKDIESIPYIRPESDGPEMKYLRELEGALGGQFPVRRRNVEAPLPVPKLDAFKALLEDSGEREFSTTMAYSRALGALIRDKVVGPRLVPIVSDETRTFGMEGMFRQVGMYSALGQLYRPQDADQLMWYREDKTGQILQEGINEAGAISSWMAAATSYSTHGKQMIPFFIFYSMFGFQRIGDFIWAAGDLRSRGFLMGGTSGRTTLNGEGLQHEDGQSHIMASFIPNCVSYDPTYAYELAVIMQDGLRRMIGDQEDVFYYITVMNENYHHPAMPAGVEDGILRGLYQRSKGEGKKGAPRVRLLGSGTILREVEAAVPLLAEYGIVADVYSATSMNELRRDGLDAERWSLLHPTEKARTSWVAQQLNGSKDPVICSTDYMKTYSDQIRQFVDGPFVALGTDGFGRSDTREKLRAFFEVDRRWVTVAALKALADAGTIQTSVVAKAIAAFGLDTDKPNPMTV